MLGSGPCLLLGGRADLGRRLPEIFWTKELLLMFLVDLHGPLRLRIEWGQGGVLHRPFAWPHDLAVMCHCL